MINASFIVTSHLSFVGAHRFSGCKTFSAGTGTRLAPHVATTVLLPLDSVLQENKVVLCVSRPDRYLDHGRRSGASTELVKKRMNVLNYFSLEAYFSEIVTLIFC